MSGPLVTSGSGRQPQWLRRKERGAHAAIKLFVWLAMTLGRHVGRIMLTPICLYFLIFSLESRRASRAYLYRALGRKVTLRDNFRHYHTFASCVLDRVFFLQNRTELFDVRVFEESVVHDILARGSGCILLGAHIGSFEALRAIGHRQPNLRVKMLMFEENARNITAVLNAIEPELAKDIISLGRPDSLVTVRHCLDDGHFIGLLADRSLTNERMVSHSFLGAPAQFSVNPFRMIALLQVPVVFMAAVYRGANRYDVHFESFSGPSLLPRRPTAEEQEALVGRYVARLEHYCRSAPYNWFNFYDVWS